MSKARRKRSNKAKNVAERKVIKKLRTAAFFAQKGLCIYCRDKMTVDTCTAEHKIPRCKGGLNFENNIVASCDNCNVTKNKLTHDEFMNIVANNHPIPKDCYRSANVVMRICLIKATRKINLRVKIAENKILKQVYTRHQIKYKCTYDYVKNEKLYQ